MSYETKVLLISMAEYAKEIKAKKMHDYIVKMANAENVVIEPYEEDEEESR